VVWRGGRGLLELKMGWAGCELSWECREWSGQEEEQR
jgi:hypothetical protein